MKTIDFVKDKIENIVGQWVETGELGDLHELFTATPSIVNKVAFEGNMRGFDMSEGWQKYYVEHNKEIRKFLRGHLGTFEEYKNPKKFEKFYSDDVIDGDSVSDTEVYTEVQRIQESLSAIITDTADYYAKSKALRPHFDTMENDALFNVFYQVIESFLDHIDHISKVLSEVSEEKDIKRVALVADNLGSGLLYDFAVMSKYINKVLETVK